jgi:hypothetical protein
LAMGCPEFQKATVMPKNYNKVLINLQLHGCM